MGRVVATHDAVDVIEWNQDQAHGQHAGDDILQRLSHGAEQIAIRHKHGRHCRGRGEVSGQRGIERERRQSDAQPRSRSQ